MSFYITPAGGHGRRLEVSREALENERQAILAEHRADSLFDYLRGSTLVYELPEEEKPSKEHQERIRRLRAKQSQLEYKAMTKDVDSMLGIERTNFKSDSPLQIPTYVLGLLASVLTVSIVMFYLLYKSHGVQFALSVAVVCGAVMLVLMSVLYIVQSLKYESE